MSRIILLASAGLLAAFGAGWLFLPQALASALTPQDGSPELVSLIAAGPLGLAMVNWMGRGAIYGGIYGKPIVAGNFLTALLLTVALISLQTHHTTVLGVVMVVGALAYLAGFTRLMFWPPWGVRSGDDAGA